MGKILHFLMNESIEEEQKEIKQLQVNLYTVFEKNLEDHFLHLNVKRWECGKMGSTSSEFNSSGPQGSCNEWCLISDILIVFYLSGKEWY